MSVTSSLISLLEQHFPDEEKVAGNFVKDYVDLVDLEIEYSPAVPDPYDPRPVPVERTDKGGYQLYYPRSMGGPKTEPIDERGLKRARARYLLLRDHYYRELSLNRVWPWRTKEAVMKAYFPRGLRCPEVLFRHFKDVEAGLKKEGDPVMVIDVRPDGSIKEGDAAVIRGLLQGVE